MSCALFPLVLAATIAFADEPVDAVSGATQEPPPTDNVRPPADALYVNGKLGWFQPVGVQALYTFAGAKGPRWDADLLVEPSRYWQSVSLGGGVRPFHNALAVGVRGRWIQQHAPWSRGYSGLAESAFGLGAELGGRWALLGSDQLHLSLMAGVTASPWGSAIIPPMITIDLGVGWKVMER